jgi:hypothetical protein
MLLGEYKFVYGLFGENGGYSIASLSYFKYCL